MSANPLFAASMFDVVLGCVFVAIWVGVIVSGIWQSRTGSKLPRPVLIILAASFLTLMLLLPDQLRSLRGWIAVAGGAIAGIFAVWVGCHEKRRAWLFGAAVILCGTLGMTATRLMNDWKSGSAYSPLPADAPPLIRLLAEVTVWTPKLILLIGVSGFLFWMYERTLRTTSEKSVEKSA